MPTEPRGQGRHPLPVAASAATAATVVVWSPWIRLFHWSLVATIFVAWLTREGAGLVHDTAGYTALGLVGARVALGVFGRSEYARFTSFVRSPRETWAYARDLAAMREERYLGHNPLGGWMIVALVATVVVVGASGWLYTTDAYWGVAWVGDLHDLSADVLLWLIALHLLGVLFTSWRHRENLVGAMVRGRKREKA